ncbi:hypothetical protein M409DRAFT_48377 [Zasmidium cellare ATCC 36951]|uniref:Uncharacterized protein n=1 Tax=Zasmidium cellare ATCC 36951 TaxID=1080233 RepID=A0A6A6D2Q7_ZASCE|nr:uncharacterized protein M409DRAFT_48377 [Zasmidium cellare ATCC 36951]KAF2173393.1 hypothetical protein M409DRAFT_48377 [Zasmidium cellare ATCC 36951]
MEGRRRVLYEEFEGATSTESPANFERRRERPRVKSSPRRFSANLRRLTLHLRSHITIPNISLALSLQRRLPVCAVMTAAMATTSPPPDPASEGEGAAQTTRAPQRGLRVLQCPYPGPSTMSCVLGIGSMPVRVTESSSTRLSIRPDTLPEPIFAYAR